MKKRFLVDRVVGTENEYAFFVTDPDGNFSGNKDAVDQDGNWLSEALQCAHGRFGIFNQRLYLPNGGCVYQDLKKLEWATPECRRIRDVVAYNKAGEKLACMITAPENTNGRRFYFFKMNVAPNREKEKNKPSPRFVSFGSHENYLVHRMICPGSSTAPYIPLIPFLVTRMVYGDSGWWPDARPDRFARSQRAAFISEMHSGSSTQEGRPILHERKEPLIPIVAKMPQAYSRLHLILSDANMLEYALFLKIGATALMLSLLEAGMLPEWTILHEDTPPDNRQDAIEDLMSGIACDPDLTRPFLRIQQRGSSAWKRMSPLDVQESYLARVRRFIKFASFESPESEHEARLICSMWEETLAALSSGAHDFLMGRIDWYTKKHIADTAAQKQKACGKADVSGVYADIDVLYHAIGENSLYERLVKRSVAARMITDSEIERCLTDPPPPTRARGTRAFMRGSAVKEALTGPRGAKECWRLLQDPYWYSLKWATTPAEESGCVQTIEFIMDDPLAYGSERFDDFIARIRADASA